MLCSVCDVFSSAAYPTELAGGVLPLWGQILSGLVNFGPSFIVILGLAIPPLWIWGRSATAEGSHSKAKEKHVQLSRSRSEQYAKMVDTVLGEDT